MNSAAPVWLLLHGTPLTPAVWDGVAPLLGDAPLHRPDLTRVAPGEDQAALAARALVDIPDDGSPLRVVGHSFGGQIAIEVALAAPERIASLAILCSRDTPFPAFAEAAAALRAGQNAPDAAATLSRWFTPDELDRGGPVVEAARTSVAGADPASWAAALDAIATFDRSDRVGGIAAPTTLVAAERDGVSPPEAMREMAGRFPNPRLHVLEGAAHMSPFLDSGALAALLGATVA